MQKINWVIINGCANINDNLIIYEPDKIKLDPSSYGMFPAYPICTFMTSNIEIENGEITFSVKLEEQLGKCHIGNAHCLI